MALSSKRLPPIYTTVVSYSAGDWLYAFHFPSFHSVGLVCGEPRATPTPVGEKQAPLLPRSCTDRLGTIGESLRGRDAGRLVSRRTRQQHGALVKLWYTT